MINTNVKNLRFKNYKIGCTTLRKFRELEKLYGFFNLLVKDESENQWGTFKDRRNKQVVEKAVNEHVEVLAIITSGNAGYSLGKLAKPFGIKVVCIVDENLNNHIKECLKQYSEIVEVNLSQIIFEARDPPRDFQSEEVINLVREKCKILEGKNIWDVTNGYHEAFISIIEEIKHESPEYLITPLGSGETYYGLYEGLKKNKMETKLVGVGVHQLRNKRLLLREEPSIADKLYTPYTPYQHLIEATLKEGHLYIHVSEKQIEDAYRKVCSIIRCEPSSAAAFAALPKLNIKKDSKVIIINSGRVIF